MRVRYVGETVANLTGHYVEVPDDVPLYAATSWIEQNLGTPNKPVDELQGQEVEAEVDLTGFDEVDPMEQMREELAQLHQRLEQPDVSRAADAISSTARAMQSSWSIAGDLKKLEEDARNQTATNQSLMDKAKDFADIATSERKKTNDLIKANQNIVNNAFNSYSGEMKALRNNLAEADHEIRMLRKAASENSALLNKAAKLVKAWEARE